LAAGGSYLLARRGRASSAGAFGFDGRASDGEADVFGGVDEGVGEVVVFEFGDFAAGAADQELGGVTVAVAVFFDAADEGGEALEAVDEALFAEEIEGAVDGGGGGGAAAFTEAFEEVVGAGGAVAFEDEAEDLAAQAGEAGAALFAQGLGAVEQCRGFG